MCQTEMSAAAVEDNLAAGLPRDSSPEWTVVVVARNEEAHIRRCLESILEAMKHRSHEIMLFDSPSTDRTADIGRTLGVTVITLPDHFPLSPAAGRHVGFTRAKGRYVLFMDGDSVLDPTWVDSALSAFMEPRVAGVS